MDQGDRRRAKLRVVDGMWHGLPCREAVKLADVPLSERTAYRAFKVVRTRGEEGLTDGRHGHPYKLTAPIRKWLVEYCRGAPGTRSGGASGDRREVRCRGKHQPDQQD